ncbi:unnamed protein product [Adineta steineri]|uniref:HAT C-terminal dimerisation domain-containing protein n=1 Tax=Adineta steineri TaxID=433720 RepID=A0A814WSI7_9BILA|nr:unnamed protein product [Adineta steineri]
MDDNRTNGLCKLCSRNYKDKTGIFSNFLKHLKRKHIAEYEKTYGNEDEYLSENIENEAVAEPSTEILIATCKQTRINMSIAKNLIIKCNIPLNIVENSSFREFMKHCNIKWNPISSKKLKNDYINLFIEKMNKSIHEALNKVEHVTLTIDGWSDRRSRSFLGITCHFIDYKMKPDTCLIDFVRLKGSHTADNIYRTTERVLDHYNLKEKIFKIVTDNAANMVKAFKFGLLANDINDTDDETIGGEKIPILNTNSSDDDNIDDQCLDVNDFSFMNIEYGNSFIDDEDPTDVRLSCFVHSLQLCVRDGIKDASFMVKIFGKCKAVAQYSHKSSKIADILEELNKHINKFTVTRWNSEFLLIKSILSIDKNDLDLITSLMVNPIQFSNKDLIILKELIDILEPFYEISVRCQAETIVTASLVVPSVVHLITSLRDIKENISHCSKLVQQLDASIKKRFSGIIARLSLNTVTINDNYGDPLYFISVVLDPSFKFYWIRDLKMSVQKENQLKQHIIQLIIDEMSKNSSISTIDLDSSNSSSTASSCSTSAPKPKRRKLFDYNDSSLDNSNETTTLDPAIELDAYLNDPLRTKFSDYWSSSHLNVLKKVVTRVFSVQASSAPIERVFSHAGLILSSRRTNMSEHLFRNLVLLRVNQQLL